MKKLFALLLALALLLPLGLVPVANAEGEFTVEPFYALSWSDFDEKTYPYIDGLVWSTWSVAGSNTKITHNGASVTYGSYTDADVTKFAETLKATMDARPEGTRYWHMWAPGRILRMKPENVIYLDYGVDQMKELATAIIKKYKEIDGKLDGVVIDTEYLGISSYYIKSDTKNNTNNAVKNPLVYKEIVEDPRYATEVRPLLVERGFKFYENVTDYTPEIYGISGNAGSEYENCAAIWDTVMRNRLNAYIDEYAYEPLKTYFPEATLSDYQSSDSKPWLKLTTVTDDGVALTGGNSHKAGNVSTLSFYHGRPAESFFKELQKYAGFNDAIFEASAFNMFLFEANYAKHMYVSTDTKMVAPWITSYVYNDKREGTIANTPYYTEQLYHLGMLDPEPFLSYTYTPEYTDEEWVLTQQVMNDALAELTRVAGYSDREPIEMAPYWNGEYVLSGMYAGGRNIWRITPNTDEVSLADFKVEGTDPTFSVKGQTVTFPGGKIIEDTTIANAGSCGYWVETAAGVSPIITNDPDRFEKYPAVSYDFEDVAEGKYDYNNHDPLGAWEFTWKKGATTTIEKVGDNKVLSMNGTVELRSAKLPGNVTAGDTYAEDQAWEITVTVPEGLAAEAQIVLLNYAGTKQKVKDGGFKIENGKLYYSTLGTDEEGKAVQEYKELMDLSAGTYTFKRVMNFNDKEAFTSGYYVYGADGKELKSVKDVAVPVFTAITTVNFSTKDTADKAVLLDNYKLTVTGTAADFEIYDAATGMPVEAADTPRSSATAYRLSWLNATDSEQTVSVMAAYYEGETLKEEKVIKEVKMQPGYDNVETGVVELAEGQSVKVYLKTADEGKGGVDIGLIAIIAAAVVAVLAVVIALVATKPKKKADAPAEETKEEPKAEE